ncbi:MAG: GAF domain-containing protein [Burkholderiales bacterium]|nr:MAG: GAF domain-containing protein [Burkholderiales bacterium]
MTDSARAPAPDDAPVDWHQQEVLLIREVGRLLGRSVEPNFVIRQTLRLLSEWVGLNRGRVLLWDSGEESLRIRHWYGLTADEASRGVFARGEGVSGGVLRTGIARVVQDIDAEPDFLCRSVERARLPKETVSFIAVPLREGDRVCGVLAAHRLRHRRRGISDDLELLQTVGTLLGQVIRVNEELRRRTERLETENRDLRERLGQQLPNFGILGDSPALRDSIAQARRLATGDLTVLLLGESGTGKELFARAIHQASPRAGRPFVKVNCAAVPESLFESEFFGHERGAFTGAVTAQPGRFEQADGGTLFLDEVGELPLAMQAKLLRVLQDRVVVRVGSRHELPLDVRVVAATNRNLAAAVARGAFRLDLYYRLSVLPLQLPALRDRPQDVPVLVRHYAHEACLAWSRAPVQFSEPAMKLMQAHPWPGNVRQLQSVAMRLVLMTHGALIDAASVAAQLQAEPDVSADPAPETDSRIVPSVASLPSAVAAPAGAELVRPYAPVVAGDAERVRDALVRAGGNRSRAAQMLGMTRRQFTYRLEKLGPGGG